RQGSRASQCVLRMMRRRKQRSRMAPPIPGKLCQVCQAKKKEVVVSFVGRTWKTDPMRKPGKQETDPGSSAFPVFLLGKSGSGKTEERTAWSSPVLFGRPFCRSRTGCRLRKQPVQAPALSSGHAGDGEIKRDAYLLAGAHADLSDAGQAPAL